MPQDRIRALQRVLQTIVEHPEPHALVVACTDHETFYIVNLLGQLDEDSPSDRFCVIADPFTTASEYIDTLETIAQNAIDTPLPLRPDTAPAQRIETFLRHLLADLPSGDHRLIVALVPSEIHDAPGFTTLAETMLAAPLDQRLRLVLRDDRNAPRHLHTAAQSSSETIIAYTFSLPPELVLAEVTAAAHDRRAPPNERAQALLTLACLDLGHGRTQDALARCTAVSRLSAAPALQALALAIQSDVSRRVGDIDAALAVGLAALRLAVESNASPVVQHVALALGELTGRLGRCPEAAALFDLAHRAAPLNPEVSARAQALRCQLEATSC